MACEGGFEFVVSMDIHAKPGEPVTSFEDALLAALQNFCI